jgi:hypothetical protein
MNVQTNNGHEFVGCKHRNSKRDDFEATVEAFKAIHKQIPINAGTGAFDQAPVPL